MYDLTANQGGGQSESGLAIGLTKKTFHELLTFDLGPIYYGNFSFTTEILKHDYGNGFYQLEQSALMSSKLN